MFERFTERARKIMALANEEARRLHHEFIGTEHMLLGLVKEGQGVGVNVLENLGAGAAEVTAAVEKLVRKGPDEVAAGELPHAPGAKKVVESAIEEAQLLGHNYVGSEHLLLGLLRQQEGIAAQVLMNLGLGLDQVRAEIRQLLGRGMVPPDQPIISPEADEVMELATDEAHELGHGHVRSEHLLLGVLRLSGGLGRRLLASAGLSLASLREQIGREGEKD